MRSLCSLEGIALRVDPEFSIVNAAIPIILRRMLTDTRPGAVALLRELLLEEDRQLRIGMLEGLLRNYSVEAGKGTASQTAASGVVLKQGPPAQSQQSLPKTTDSANARGSSSKGANHQNGGRAPPPRTESTNSNCNTALWDGTSNARNGAPVAFSSEPRAAEPSVNAVETSLKARSVRNVQHSELMQQSPGVSILSEDVAGPGTRQLPGEKVIQSVATRIGTSSDVIGLVVQMTLSAKAAGVRRVVLEASMKVCPSEFLCVLVLHIGAHIVVLACNAGYPQHMMRLPRLSATNSQYVLMCKHSVEML